MVISGCDWSLFGGGDCSWSTAVSVAADTGSSKEQVKEQLFKILYISAHENAWMGEFCNKVWSSKWVLKWTAQSEWNVTGVLKTKTQSSQMDRSYVLCPALLKTRAIYLQTFKGRPLWLSLPSHTDVWNGTIDCMMVSNASYSVWD